MHQPSSTAFAFLTLFLPLLPQTVLSLQWPGPRATPTPSLPDADGWTPKPTAAPPAQHVAAVMGNTNLGLKAFRRQLSDVYKSPGTCGYVDGNGEYSFTCSASSACAYNSEISAFGCCSGTSRASDGRLYFTGSCSVSVATTDCYGSADADLCTGSCTISAAICLRSAYPLCRTVFLYGTDLLDPTTYSLYDCVPVGADTFLVLQDGFTISRSLEQNPWYDSSYTWDSDTYVPISATTSSTITSTWTLTRGGSTSTVSSTVTDRTSLPTLTPVIDEDVVRPKKTNTGAIAGGVVGGLAALGLAAGGTIWALMRRKEKARREASAVNEVSHVTYVHEGK